MTTEICSMTAYANCQQNLVGVGLMHADIKAVNSKFLDLNIKLPDYLANFEPVIRKIISSHLGRGKIDFSLSVNLDAGYRFESLYADQINDYIALYSSISAQLTAKNISTQEFSIGELIKHLNSHNQKPQFTLSNEATAQDLHAFIIKLTTDLVHKLLANRFQEGKELATALRNLLSKISNDIQQLEVLQPQVQQELAVKFRNKLSDITHNFINLSSTKEYSLNMADLEPKLAQEVSSYLNKIDVAEELTRLKIHVEAVAHALDQGGVIGRKLDFLMQELMREANTLSAKSVNVEFRNLAINLKLYIEQMREQIQNIE